MKRLEEFLDLFKKGVKRHHLIGDGNAGVVAGLDVAGRLYAVVDGEVLNRVNPKAILGVGDRTGFLNPGGDGLWPAPEGTRFGYEYATGQWRVPPGLTGARYRLVEDGPTGAKIEAEIDLINSQGLGIPMIFSRDVSVTGGTRSVHVRVEESFQYIGTQTLSRDECLIAPWTLCQFDSGPGCEVVFPDAGDDSVWDLYDPSDDQRFVADGLRHTKTDGSARYQIAMAQSVDWIEFRNPETGLTVKRTAEPIGEGLSHIDIIDAPPDATPSDKGVRFSVYGDTNGFMEIEAAGGCPETISPGTTSSLVVETTYQRG